MNNSKAFSPAGEAYSSVQTLLHLALLLVWFLLLTTFEVARAKVKRIVEARLKTEEFQVELSMRIHQIVDLLTSYGHHLHHHLHLRFANLRNPSPTPPPHSGFLTTILTTRLWLGFRISDLGSWTLPCVFRPSDWWSGILNIDTRQDRNQPPFWTFSCVCSGILLDLRYSDYWPPSGPPFVENLTSNQTSIFRILRS